MSSDVRRFVFSPRTSARVCVVSRVASRGDRTAIERLRRARWRHYPPAHHAMDDVPLPKIYVYDVPSKFTTDMTRKWKRCYTDQYGTEVFFHEALTAGISHPKICPLPPRARLLTRV